MHISQSAVIIEIDSLENLSSDDSNSLLKKFNKLENFSNRFVDHLMLMKNK